MNKIQRVDVSLLLNNIAQSLDISDSLSEEAERKYQAVGSWLGDKNSPLVTYSPVIYPQGSFRLGTVIKPLNDADDYDIDVVLRLILAKEEITQHNLKKMVGDRLKANEMYRHMLDEEGRRCWTLQYAGDVKFHLDILPAIPDLNFQFELQQKGLPYTWAGTSIAITDNTLPNYNQVDPGWPRSNPIGYATWFRERMKVKYSELQKHLAEEMKAEIEKVPDYKIKTPLQRCIQLIKRNRDIRFENDQEDKPISIIISTLAAHAYNNETDLGEALINIVEKMPNYISIRDGRFWIPNPVNPLENFADRWNEHPHCDRKLRTWLNGLAVALDEVLECEDIDKVGRLLESLFGEKVTMATILKFRESTIAKRTPTYPAVTITNPNKPWGF